MMDCCLVPDIIEGEFRSYMKKMTDTNTTAAGFGRRYYSSWRSFWKDLVYMVSNRDEIRHAMRSEEVDEVFRERLMLAVTEVNQCRYCRTFHIGQAKEAGISMEETDIYLKGTIPDDIPEEQKLAVCYAQHWAETDNNPDHDYLDQVREEYGEEGFEAISMVLRMIRMGNLLGNSVDYFLYRISFGRLGN
jgi:AhpD family alkylhydroperoxidase